MKVIGDAKDKNGYMSDIYEHDGKYYRKVPQKDNPPKKHKSSFKGDVGEETIIIVHPNGHKDIIWIQNKGKKSGIYGTYQIRPSEGNLGFGIGISNKAGDPKMLVALGSHQHHSKRKFIETNYIELLMPNERGRKTHSERRGIETNPPSFVTGNQTLIVPKSKKHLAEMEKKLKDQGYEIKEVNENFFFGSILSNVIGQVMIPVLLIIGGVIVYKIISSEQRNKERKQQAQLAQTQSKSPQGGV